MTASGRDAGHNTCVFSGMTIFPYYQWDSYSQSIRFPMMFQPRQAYFCVAGDRKVGNMTKTCCLTFEVTKEDFYAHLKKDRCLFLK
jgi:hypothetical protein